jgi:hypothetical protein
VGTTGTWGMRARSGSTARSEALAGAIALIDT